MFYFYYFSLNVLIKQTSKEVDFISIRKFHIFIAEEICHLRNMHQNPFVRILVVQGTLLIINGLTCFAIVGAKGTNMMLAGALLGIAMWISAYLSARSRMAIWAGLGLSMGGLVIFVQRTIANFLSLIGIVQHEMNFDAYNKSIMVVLYVIMSVTCLTGLMMLYTYLPEKKSSV